MTTVESLGEVGQPVTTRQQCRVVSSFDRPATIGLLVVLGRRVPHVGVRRQGQPAVAGRGLRVVGLGRQPGAADDQHHADLQERDAQLRRHEPAEVEEKERPPSSRSPRSRSCSSSASLQGRGRRPPGEEGDLPLALAAEHRARRPAPVVQVGPLRRPARRHPAELSPRRTTGCTSCADKDEALYLKHESHFERFIAYDAELAVPSRSRSAAVPTNTPCRT